MTIDARMMTEGQRESHQKIRAEMRQAALFDRAHEFVEACVFDIFKQQMSEEDILKLTEKVMKTVQL